MKLGRNKMGEDYIFGKQSYGIDGKAKKDILSYICPWCGYNFKHYVTKSGNQKKHDGSTQIVCPTCNKFIKTYKNKKR